MDGNAPPNKEKFLTQARTRILNAGLCPPDEGRLLCALEKEVSNTEPKELCKVRSASEELFRQVRETMRDLEYRLLQREVGVV